MRVMIVTSITIGLYILYYTLNCETIISYSVIFSVQLKSWSMIASLVSVSNIPLIRYTGQLSCFSSHQAPVLTFSKFSTLQCSIRKKYIILDQSLVLSFKYEVLCIYQCIHKCSLDGYSTFFEFRGRALPLFVWLSLLTRYYQAVNVDLYLPNLPPTVDTSSTRGNWVSSYEYGKKDFEWDIIGHWVYLCDNTLPTELFLTSNQLPSGPGFLDLETLNYGYHEHLIAMHGSDSWVHSSILAVKHILSLQEDSSWQEEDTISQYY